MPPKTDHLQDTKLPTEEELRIYMDSLEIESPYRFPENVAKSIRAWLYDDTTIPDMSDSTVAYLFRDATLKPSIYNGGTREIEFRRHSIQNNSDYFWNRKSDAFRRSWARMDYSSTKEDHKRISCASQLSSFTFNWRNTLGSFRNYHNYRFIDALHHANLIDTKSDPAIREEIALRKRQYPNQKIYLFLGRQLSGYYRGINLGKHLNDAILIEVDYFSTANKPNTWLFPHWGSAIVAEHQAKINYSLHYDYEIGKIPRWWKIQLWMWTKFKIKVDERQSGLDVIQEGPQKPSRFGMIEM